MGDEHAIQGKASGWSVKFEDVQQRLKQLRVELAELEQKEREGRKSTGGRSCGLLVRAVGGTNTKANYKSAHTNPCS